MLYRFNVRMSKKEYILLILNALETDRPLAKDLKRFLLLDKFDDHALDGLTEFFKQGIQNVKSEKVKEKLQKSVALLAKIQELEKADMLQNEQECLELEAMLQHL